MKLQGPGLVVAGRQILVCPVGAIGEHLPGIARAGSGVDDERAGGAVLRRIDVLVVPAAVPESDAGALEGRVEVHHHHDLAANVHVLVVVPAVLGGGDAVAHEYDRRVLHRGPVDVRVGLEDQVRRRAA